MNTLKKKGESREVGKVGKYFLASLKPRLAHNGA